MKPEKPAHAYETPMDMPRRRIIFDMSVSLETHPSSQPENIEGPVRLFALNVSNPTDKCMMISAIFNGPVDPNFHLLVSQLKIGLDIVQNQSQPHVATEPEMQSEPETTDPAVDLAILRQRRMEPLWRSRLAKYRAKQARRGI